MINSAKRAGEKAFFLFLAIRNGCKMPNQNFGDPFWIKRCVTIDKPEVEVAADTDPPVEGAVTEGDYDEYSAMINSVIQASEAVLEDVRESKQCLHQRLWLV